VVTDPQHGELKQTFVKYAKDSNQKKQITGALCLGEYGKLVDLSKDAEVFTLI
jgi:hypothetical protein